jgi:hypothetical protein
MSWKPGIIEAVTAKGRRPIVGWVCGPFGLDFRAVWFFDEESPDGSVGWTLTHRPTGMALFGLRMPLAEAQAIVDEIAAWADWPTFDPSAAPFLKARVQGLRERLPHHLIHANDMMPPWAVTEFGDAEPDGKPRMTLVQ